MKSINVMPRLRAAASRPSIAALGASLALALTGLRANAAETSSQTPAHRHGDRGSSRTDELPSAQAPAQLPPLTARYRVTRIDATARLQAAGSAARSEEWIFSRSADRVALIKGAVEEIWHRAGDGAIRLQRVLHEEHTVVDYAPHDLAALGVAVDWQELSTFMDERNFTPTPAHLPQDARRSSHGNSSEADGSPGRPTLTLAWQAQAQLPARLTRRLAAGATVTYTLIEHKTQAPDHWPIAGTRGAHYPHIRAADLDTAANDPTLGNA